MRQSVKIFAALAFAFFCGCQVVTPEKRLGNIAVEPVITRATETDFEKGDKIGVSITRAGAAYTTNECMTFESDMFTSSLPWYDSGEMNSDFVAYYPYAASVPTTFAVATDQSGDAYGTSDLMAAVKKDVTPQATVAMVFKHLLTRIVIDIDNQGGAPIQSVVLKNAVVDANVDIAAQQCTPVEGAATADITAHMVAVNTRYSAIVVPQTVQFAVTVQVQNGAALTKKLSEVTLKAGGQYSISMTVLPTDVNVAISGQIEAWSDEGIIPEKQVTFHEYETYFEYDDVKYNTVVLKDGNKWMAENLRFIPEGYTPTDNIEALNNGMWYPLVPDPATWSSAAVAAKFSRDEKDIVTNGYLYSVEVALGLKPGTMTAENCTQYEGAQGVCPPGWHIPTVADCTGLIGACSNSAMKNTNAPYFDKTLGTNGSGSLAKLNADGANMGAYGCFYIANTAAVKASIVGPVISYLEGFNTGYFAGSSVYKADKNTDGSLKNIQVYGFMPAVSAGTMNTAYVAYRAGVAVRCVKNRQ